MKLNDRELNEMVNTMQTNDVFDLQPPEGCESDEDSLGDLDTNDSIEIEIEDSRDEMDAYADDLDFEDDGQPDEYTEWQDFMGGDDWDHGQYDSEDFFDGGVDF